MKAAVLGATGYTGLVLLRLLGQHPDVRRSRPSPRPSPVRLSARSTRACLPAVEQKMAASGKLSSLADAAKAAEARELDVVFSGLPHLKSAEICAPFFGRCVVIDLSADFRFRSADAFQKAYGAPPARPDLLARRPSAWPSGTARACGPRTSSPTRADLPDLHAPSTPPPCPGRSSHRYHHRERDLGDLGSRGKERANLLYCERTENANAYNPGNAVSRHAPEIEKQLEGRGRRRSLSLHPHLAPIKRGMCVTTVAELPGRPTRPGPASIRGIYEKYYGGRPFISLAGSRIPQTREVWGSNRCDMGWRLEGEPLMLFSVIDNLMKGASGQAVQNMNIRFGLDEAAGLSGGASCERRAGHHRREDRRQGRRARRRSSGAWAPRWPRGRDRAGSCSCTAAAPR